MSSEIAACETSPVSKYARILLLLIAVTLVVWFGGFALRYQSGILCLVASLILLGTQLAQAGNQLFRVILLVSMMVNVFAVAINAYDFVGTDNNPSELIEYVLLLCLAIASFFEIAAWAKSSSRSVLVKTCAWGVLLIPGLVYILVIPVIEWAWIAIEADEKKLALKDPDWNILNEATFRSAKLAAFVVFAFLGACLGSFLNVVAHCVPKGESIGLRDSKCPRCGHKLRRIDNIPVFSYINLGANCRDCSAPISARYLIVEIVVAAIFASLFAYELITGCDNVPLMGVFHKGILWVVLYPKWPAIAIYFYHAFFMCLVLVLALMETDRLPLRRSFAVLSGLVFVACPIAYHRIQPVPLLEHIPGLAVEFTMIVEQSLKVVAGGALGAVLGYVSGKWFSASHPSMLTFAFFLTGVVLGWQATLQVALVFAIICALTSGVARLQPKARAVRRYFPTTLLFIAITIHHPFWNQIADLWRF